MQGSVCGKSALISTWKYTPLGKTSHGNYVWQRDGTWVYTDIKKIKELNSVVPLTDGLDASKDHLSHLETQGKSHLIPTCPSGKAKGHITNIQNKTQEWLKLRCRGRCAIGNPQYLPHTFWPPIPPRRFPLLPGVVIIAASLMSASGIMVTSFFVLRRHHQSRHLEQRFTPHP